MTALTEEQHDAILAARKALRQSLSKRFPPRLANILITVAIADAFLDLCRASAEDGRAALIDTINDALAELGLKLTPRRG